MHRGELFDLLVFVYRVGARTPLAQLQNILV